MQTVVYGKCIIAGEHAVLRGTPAIVFPVRAKSLNLVFSQSEDSVVADFSGDYGSEMKLLFHGVLSRALKMTSREMSDASGRFQISNSIPVGAGLGASAALCVAVGRWICWKGWLAESELPEFCRKLEDLFHGESSGVDVAVAISEKGLHFERNGARYTVSANWNPLWFLSYSGKRGITAECIEKVKALWQIDADLGQKIDQEMAEAVRLAESALQAQNSEEGFDLLATAIQKARICFEHWGLVNGEAGQHLQMLLAKGAYAVKPTGSGDGGFALSLWRKPPPDELMPILIPL